MAGQQEKATGDRATALLRRSLACFSLNSTRRESIFSLLSLCSCPPGLALPPTAWGVMSCCPDESKAFCGWAHLSSVVSPQLWRLPCLLLFKKRLALTLSAAAGTFENNCLYDCYFSYLFEEVYPLSRNQWLLNTGQGKGSFFSCVSERMYF